MAQHSSSSWPCGSIVSSCNHVRTWFKKKLQNSISFSLKVVLSLAFTFFFCEPCVFICSMENNLAYSCPEIAAASAAHYEPSLEPSLPAPRGSSWGLRARGGLAPFPPPGSRFPALPEAPRGASPAPEQVLHRGRGWVRLAWGAAGTKASGNHPGPGSGLPLAPAGSSADPNCSAWALWRHKRLPSCTSRNIFRWVLCLTEAACPDANSLKLFRYLTVLLN